MPDRKPVRIAISSSLDDSLLQHLPSGVAAIRYHLHGDEQLEADMVVIPSFGPDAGDILKRTRTRYVQTISAGVETVQPFVPPGAVLCNARGVHDATTAEWTLTAILASLKWLPLYGRLQEQGRWAGRAETDAYWQQTYGGPHDSGTPVLVEELAGKTVLIVGYGAIGKAIEARLQPFEPARVLRIARTPREGVAPVADLHRLLPEADIVVLITPLTPETRHLIGAAELALMRRGALLVNAARGGVVDTDALVAALESHRIRAALDVTDPEPLPPGHPLWKAPGLLLTPHIAGSIPAFLDRVFRFVGAQAERLLRGEEPENIIHGAY